MLQKLEDVKDYVNDHITAVSRTPDRPSPQAEAEFAAALAELLREHHAVIYYTNADDGLHVTLNGKEALGGKGFWNLGEIPALIQW